MPEHRNFQTAATPQGGDALLEEARRIGIEVLRKWAPEVDRENRFPRESINAIREAGLLAYFVPGEFGGIGGDVRTFARIAESLGRECLSTGMIWAMHAHQLLILVDQLAENQREILENIAKKGWLLASVTTEFEKGGDVLHALSPLVRENGKLRIHRKAPCVSYGKEAGYFLITMRSSLTSPTTNVELVLVSKEDKGIEVTGDWNAMGMRGTRSVPMVFDVLVPENRLVAKNFRKAALMSLVPAAHIGWTAAWLGAAQGAFDRFVESTRLARSPRMQSDLFLSKLAAIRIPIDLTRAILARVADHYQDLRESNAPMSAFEDVTYNIMLNNLKVAGATYPLEAVNGLIELAGMAGGYLQSSSLALERTFRDLRSASLMFGNDRLLAANGRLLLVENTAFSKVWQRD